MITANDYDYTNEPLSLTTASDKYNKCLSIMNTEEKREIGKESYDL